LYPGWNLTVLARFFIEWRDFDGRGSSSVFRHFGVGILFPITRSSRSWGSVERLPRLEPKIATFFRRPEVWRTVENTTEALLELGRIRGEGIQILACHVELDLGRRLTKAEEARAPRIGLKRVVSATSDGAKSRGLML
jgi:hypothetical protein